jgi:hypothetical protein
MKLGQRIVFWFDTLVVNFKSKHALRIAFDCISKDNEPEAEKYMKMFFALKAKYYAKYPGMVKMVNTPDLKSVGQ